MFADAVGRPSSGLQASPPPRSTSSRATVRRSATCRPGTEPASTLQIGDLDVIAARLDVPVVGDFRAADVAHGGAGAPLMPYLDRVLFRDRARDGDAEPRRHHEPHVDRTARGTIRSRSTSVRRTSSSTSSPRGSPNGAQTADLGGAARRVAGAMRRPGSSGACWRTRSCGPVLRRRAAGRNSGRPTSPPWSRRTRAPPSGGPPRVPHGLRGALGRRRDPPVGLPGGRRASLRRSSPAAAASTIRPSWTGLRRALAGRFRCRTLARSSASIRTPRKRSSSHSWETSASSTFRRTSRRSRAPGRRFRWGRSPGDSADRPSSLTPIPHS